MSNAHRPTFNAAKGRDDSSTRWVASFAVSKYSLPANTKLKRRVLGQNNKDELKTKDFRNDLLEREKESVLKKRSDERILSIVDDPEKKDVERKEVLKKDGEEEADSKVKNILEKFDDEDDKLSDSESESESDAGSDSDDDDDEDSELLKELEKIKKEREDERLRKEKEEREKQAKDVLSGNELLKPQLGSSSSESSSFSLKRKWNDNTVFRNQAKDQPKKKKRFINDTIRNDFHRSFMDKYMR